MTTRDQRHGQDDARDAVLDKLNAMLPAQFEEVVFRLRVPPGYLSHGGPQMTRAIELVRHLEGLKRIGELESLLGLRRSAPEERASKEEAPPASKSAEEQADTKTDFVIITALEEEREAVLSKLPGWRKLDQDGRDVHVYYEAFVQTRRADKSRYRVIVTSLSGMGPIRAASHGGDVVRRWQPAHVLLVGIAGGLSGEVALGDVMISSQIADYTLGKQTPGGQREVRWEVHPVDALLLSTADNFATGFEDLVAQKRPDKGRPTRRKGVIASGGDVVAFKELVAEYKEAWGKLIGIEMEGGGLASALWDSVERPRFLMVRGVSDIADGARNAATKAQWRSYAADVAAAYAVGLLREGPASAGQQPATSRVTEAVVRPATTQSGPASGDKALCVILFADSDRPVYDRLYKHLKVVLRSRDDFEVWSKADIMGGDLVATTESRIGEAAVVVLLVSHDFLADDDDFDAAEQIIQGGRSRVVPVIVSPCEWKTTAIGRLQSLPRNGEPVSAWRDKDQAMTEVAREIGAVVTSAIKSGSLPARTSSSSTGAVHPSAAHAPAAGTSESAVNSASASSSTQVQGPVKILFVTASPTGAAPALVAEEFRDIERRIKAGTFRGRFQIQYGLATTPSELSQRILDVEPRIVHFSGHSSKKLGGIVLQDEMGNGVVVPPAALADLFELAAKRGVRGVVLNACFTDEQAAAIARHVEFVVGISGEIEFEPARRFAAGFYGGLVSGESVQDAFKRGCVEVNLNALPDSERPKLVVKKKGIKAASLFLLK